MYQMVDQGAVEWDVVLLGPEETPASPGDYLEKLDYSIINTDGIPAGGVHDYGVTSDYYSMVLAYRKDAFPNNPPQSWADFWTSPNSLGRGHCLGGPTT